MRLRSIIFLLPVLLVALCGPAEAQQWLKMLKSADRAAGQSASSAARAAKSIKNVEVLDKAFAKVRPNSFVASAHYPAVPLPGNASPRTLGVVINTNKQLFAQTVFLQALQNRLKKFLIKEPQAFSHAPATLPDQIARFIPPQARYVFMGEYHNHYQLTRKLQQTIVAYKRLYPEKQVIVLSEFAADSYPHFWKLYFGHPLYTDFLVDAGLPVAGLEKEPVNGLKRVARELEMPVERTLPGLQARNNHWAARIRAWRKKYPDAVFFIHTGNAHIGYHEPSSVARTTPQKETFVMQFLPANFYKGTLDRMEFFHQTTNGRYYRPGILAAQTDEAAHLAGFNAQVILPEY